MKTRYNNIPACQPKNQAFLTRSLVKAYRWEELRFYAIARIEFSARAGWFTLPELLDRLHAHYSYRTLHHGPGNNRKREAHRLAGILSGSPLFTAHKNKYRFISWRRLGDTRSPRVELTGATLTGSQAFHDLCTLTLIQGRHVPIQSVCDETGLSRGQVYKSINRLIAAGLLDKVNQYALTEGMSEREARAARCSLKAAGVDVDIIESKTRPAVFAHWGMSSRAGAFHIAYKMPNFYRLRGIAQGLRDIARLPFQAAVCHYQRLDGAAFRVTDSQAVYAFTDHYDEAAYIQDHARFYAVA